MLRLVLLSLLFLASLLCLFPAPMYYLWYVGILVTEFSWLFLAATGLLLVCGIWTHKYATAGTVIGIIIFVIFLSSIFQAYTIASNLDGELQTAFSDNGAVKSNQRSPYNFLRTFTGINALQISYTTFTYASYPGKDLTLDYYPSQTSGNRPCIVVVHGGSWSSGDSRQLPELNTHLARLGYNVAAISYRLAPQYHSPMPVADVANAIAYLQSKAPSLHIDTGNFILLGRSAGGQIVLSAAYTLHNPAIKGVVAYYGPADMVWGYHNPANPLVLNSCGVMEAYLGGTYKQVPREYVQSSAVETVGPESVPTLLIHGKKDPLVGYGHSTRLEKKLKQYGIKHYLLTLPWGTHGCDYTLNGPSGQLSTYTVERFLKAVTD